jgi:hypothetical protein
MHSHAARSADRDAKDQDSWDAAPWWPANWPRPEAPFWVAFERSFLQHRPRIFGILVRRLAVRVSARTGDACRFTALDRRSVSHGVPATIAALLPDAHEANGLTPLSLAMTAAQDG